MNERVVWAYKKYLIGISVVSDNSFHESQMREKYFKKHYKRPFNYYIV